MGKTPRELPPGPHGRRRLVTPDEARIWRAVVKDAVPLPGRALAEPEPEPAIPPPAPVPAAAPLAVRPPAAAHPPRPKAAQPELAHGHAPGLDRRSGERLKQGRMEIDGRLDLHGMTQDAAHGALTAFVTRGFDAGRRCLLVVTGKGREGSGVLKHMVPRWLNQSPLRERIIGFSYATVRHGGEGALYVLVRRRR